MGDAAGARGLDQRLVERMPCLMDQPELQRGTAHEQQHRQGEQHLDSRYAAAAATRAHGRLPPVPPRCVSTTGRGGSGDSVTGSLTAERPAIRAPVTRRARAIHRSMVKGSKASAGAGVGGAAGAGEVRTAAVEAGRGGEVAAAAVGPGEAEGTGVA